MMTTTDSHDDVHPVLRQGGFQATTLPVRSALAKIDERVTAGHLSACLYAKTRFGKTSMARIVFDKLDASKELVPFWSHVAHYEERNPAAKFWSNIHRHRHAERLGEHAGRDSILRRVQVECDIFKTRRAVFIFDEAQALDVTRLDMLKWLTETLLNLGYQPFVLLVAQRQIFDLEQKLAERQRDDLAARFLSEITPFRGLNEEGVNHLLKLYDKRVWPADSGTTYTAHFAGSAWWDRGFRLGSYGKELWDAFVRLHIKLGVQTEDLELATLFVTQACLSVLQAQKDAKALPSGAIFDAAVNGSSLASVTAFEKKMAASQARRVEPLPKRRRRGA